jgi:hypothetical protein
MAANLVDNAAGQHVPRSETLDTELLPIHNDPEEHSVAGMNRPPPTPLTPGMQRFSSPKGVRYPQEDMEIWTRMGRWLPPSDGSW